MKTLKWFACALVLLACGGFPASPAFADDEPEPDDGAADEREPAAEDGDRGITVEARPVPQATGAPGTTSSSPLGLDSIYVPKVPLTEPRSHDVLGPRRVFEATPVTVEEIANRLPGVSSRLYSGDEYVRPSISMRGMPDNGFTEYTGIYVDDINYSSLFYGWTALSIFPFSAERIWAAEVYRGAHALRRGPNTIGGVVNFVTAPIPDRRTFRERLVYGSYNYHSSFTEAGGPICGTPLSVLVQFVEKSGDTFRDDNDFDLNELALKTHYDFSSCSWLELNLFHWRAVHGLPSRLTKAQLDKDREQNLTPSEANWAGWAYGADFTFHRDVCRGTWWEVYGYGRKARRALDSPRPSSGPPYTTIRSADSDNYNLGVGARGEVRLGTACPNTIHWGVRYHQERIERLVFTEPIGGGPRTTTQDAVVRTGAFSFNVDDTLELGRLEVVFGARVEWIPESRADDDVTGNDIDFDYFDVFPGVSASYQLGRDWAVFANWHNSFRAPQVWSYNFAGLDQSLDFEHGTNVEAGARYENACYPVSANLVAWYVDFSDFIDYDPISDTYTNLGSFASHGIDLTWDVGLECFSRRLCGWSVFGTTTWQDSEFTGTEFDGQRTTHVPDWIFSGGVRYQHRSGFYGVLEANYWGDAAVDPENTLTTGDWLLWDARVGWRTICRVGCLDLELDVALAAKNLLDKEYDLQHRADSYVPGPPRQLYATLSLGLDF